MATVDPVCAGIAEGVAQWAGFLGLGADIGNATESHADTLALALDAAGLLTFGSGLTIKGLMEAKRIDGGWEGVSKIAIDNLNGWFGTIGGISGVSSLNDSEPKLCTVQRRG